MSQYGQITQVCIVLYLRTFCPVDRFGHRTSSSSTMRLKIKTAAGSGVISAEDSWTLSRLIECISADVPALKGKRITSLKCGFPPKALECDPQTLLAEAGIHANDQILVETQETSPVTASQAPAKVTPSTNDKIANVYIEALNSYLILRNVPDDNACLFNAITYTLQGTFKWHDLDLREIVASTIEANPDTYNELVLGRPRDEYCEWIRKSESWGGAIELGILSEFLGVRINCFDVELGRKMVFQDEQNKPTKFICLVYSGIHYDCFVTNPVLTENKSGDSGNWTDHEDIVIQASSQLVALLQKRNYTTNTTTFRVRCLDCYEILLGEMGASKHANSTGHFRFGEVK